MACRLSNAVLCVMNFLMFLASMPLLGSVMWLGSTKSSMCENSVHGPALVLVLFLITASLIGIMGSCCGVSVLLGVYLVGMLMLIVVTLVFTLWAFVATNSFVGRIVSGQQVVGGYRLGDYSHWLQRRVDDETNWKKVRICLAEVGVCKLWYDALSSSSVLDANGLPLDMDPSPVQFGCCQRPPECVVQNSTTPSVMLNSTNDCGRWNEDANTLCYDCNSCKMGVLAEVEKNWHILSIANLILLLSLTVLYSIGCCALKNNAHDKYQRFRGP